MRHEQEHDSSWDLGHGGRHLRGQRHDGGEPLPQRPDAARVARLPGEDEIFSIDIYWPRPALAGAARPGGLVALQQGGDVLPGAGGGAGRASTASSLVSAASGASVHGGLPAVS